MWNKITNFITGLMGFGFWVFLTKNNSSDAINIAIGVLLILVGFGGRDTIIDIIKTYKGE